MHISTPSRPILSLLFFRRSVAATWCTCFVYIIPSCKRRSTKNVINQFGDGIIISYSWMQMPFASSLVSCFVSIAFKPSSSVFDFPQNIFRSHQRFLVRKMERRKFKCLKPFARIDVVLFLVYVCVWVLRKSLQLLCPSEQRKVSCWVMRGTRVAAQIYLSGSSGDVTKHFA